jgi:hypothetical protein
MKRRFIHGGVLLVLVAMIAFGGWWLAERLWGNYEGEVTLLSERVTLGPKPLVIRAPWWTSAWGSSFWLTVYLTREKVCEGTEWAKEEAKRLPVIHAVAVTSDGQRHPMSPSDCCATNVCGALKLKGRPSDQDYERRLVRIELFAPQPVLVEKVRWRTGGMQPVHLGR